MTGSSSSIGCRRPPLGAGAGDESVPNTSEGGTSVVDEPPGASGAGSSGGGRGTAVGDVRVHGLIIDPAQQHTWSIGDIVRLAVPHCDPTVNLYDAYHVVAGETLQANALRILEDGLVMKSEANLIVSKAADWTPMKKAQLEALLSIMGGIPPGISTQL